MRRFRPGRGRRRRSATTFCCAFRPKSSPAARSSGACSRAKKARRCAEGIGEATRAGQIFDFFAGEALRIPGEKFASVRPNVDIEVTREPLGVVGIIAPWNFPLAIPAWKIAPALAYGNTVVFKPADLVPGCAHALAEIIVRAGVPKGVFNLVVGRGSVVGQAILDHKKVDAVTFTGSVATGAKVAAACAKAHAPVPARNGRQESARRARRRRPSRTRSNARSTAPISRPASAARPRRASSSRSRSTGASPTRSRSGCADSSSTTR